ncbi:hydrolase [Agrococcus sp. ARC_14]|uniref:hydrolase n=1 Tax=Agrococcus sp. ARC_14 TaxID=2919927 RepID=UPI001F0594CD|nr:hydrolase [Agrococcus sp. ARC_14]MCH1884271.1 hydrolase [Agrococcus sp. ARC_14]
MTILCATCGVESAEPLPETCPICADERQWVPRHGQVWTSVDVQQRDGMRVDVVEDEPGLWAITSEPAVGIGQRALLVQTDGGNLLWDPIGTITDAAVEQVRELGGLVAVAASHPHMFGVQCAWADALDARVLVNRRDASWIQRQHERVELWDQEVELLPGVRLIRFGGHFPGSAMVVWQQGSDGEGSLLAGDTIQPKPDRASLGFMRSFPNNIPMSPGVVRRIADQLAPLRYRRIYGNIPGQLIEDGPAAVERSAARHIAWCRGEHDDLT